MIDGTERSVLELLFERGPHSPTEVADALGVSVQTASRNLRELADRGFVRADWPGAAGDHRGYKVYEPVEFASVFAGIEGRLIDRTLGLSDEKRAILSVWQVPQEEFHPVLASYLFGRAGSDGEREFDVTALAVYGSVARGEAKPDSDVDVLGIADGVDPADTPFNRSFIQDGGPLGFGSNRVVSETWYRQQELIDGLESGSSFLANALEEAIPIYDPDGVLRNARPTETGRRVSRPG